MKLMNELMYPRLSQIVEARPVFVIAKKHCHYTIPEGAIGVRFNDDTIESDILCTAFHLSTKHHPITVRTARLIVCTVPNTRVMMSDGKLRDFGSDISHFRSLSSRAEMVDVKHWLELAKKMPIWPLSGLCFLDMVLRTGAESVTLIGFNFYGHAIENAPIKKGLYWSSVHDIYQSILWLQDVKATDTRVRLESDFDLGELASKWKDKQHRELRHNSSVTVTAFDVPPLRLRTVYRRWKKRFKRIKYRWRGK